MRPAGVRKATWPIPTRGLAAAPFNLDAAQSKSRSARCRTADAWPARCDRRRFPQSIAVRLEQIASVKSVSRRLTSHNLVGFHIDARESAVTLSRGPTPTASTSRIRAGNRAVSRRWPLEINDLTVLLASLPKMSNSFRLSTNASLLRTRSHGGRPRFTRNVACRVVISADGAMDAYGAG